MIFFKTLDILQKKLFIHHSKLLILMQKGSIFNRIICFTFKEHNSFKKNIVIYSLEFVIQIKKVEILHENQLTLPKTFNLSQKFTISKKINSNFNNGLILKNKLLLFAHLNTLSFVTNLLSKLSIFSHQRFISERVS